MIAWKCSRAGSHAIAIIPMARVDKIDLATSSCIFVPDSLMGFIWRCVAFAKEKQTEILFTREAPEDGTHKIH